MMSRAKLWEREPGYREYTERLALENGWEFAQALGYKSRLPRPYEPPPPIVATLPHNVVWLHAWRRAS